MPGYGTTGFEVEPINAPHMVPLGEWWAHHLYAVAHCTCGRVAVVHTSELLKRLNHHQAVSAAALAKFAESVKCIRCGAKGPKLTLEVRRD
jgi:hypothetical protein